VKHLEVADRTLLADQAYQMIRTAVLSGDFPAGEPLRERQLAEQIGVSRVPVREALRRLGEEGLLEQLPHRGHFVRAFTSDEIVDIYNVRLALEPSAVRLATRMRKPLTTLESAVDAMRAALARGEITALNRLELEFHQALCDLSGNRMLSDSFAAIAGQVLLAMSLDNLAYPDRQHIADEHVPLIEAIASGDEKRAVEAIIAHVVGTIDQLFDAMDASPATRARLLYPTEGRS
jgi:GntR family transcriptional regulator of gluconate operon